MKRLLCLLGLAAVLGGCSNKDKFIGRWSGHKHPDKAVNSFYETWEEMVRGEIFMWVVIKENGKATTFDRNRKLGGTRWGKWELLGEGKKNVLIITYSNAEKDRFELTGEGINDATAGFRKKTLYKW